MWPSSMEDLEAAQRALEPLVSLNRPPRLDALGGCFVCFARGGTGRGAAGDAGWAAAAVLVAGRPVAEAVVSGRAGGPYLPGYLALREGGLLRAAVLALPVFPDVLLVNASGRDHPRRAGLARHLGAALDLPSVGVTHRPFLATGPWPPDRRGATSPLRIDGEWVGCWVRTRRGARPLAVSPGWGIDRATAVQTVLVASVRARTPEPIRHARRLARLARAGRIAGVPMVR